MEEIIYVSENLREEDTKFVQDGEEIKCAKSREIMPTGTQYFTTANGHNVNAKFFDEFYAYCEDCGSIRRQTDMLFDESDEVYYCNHCRVECADCGRLISRDDAYEYRGEYICDDCYCESYFTCENCGRIEHIDNGCWSDRDECYYCDDCWDDMHQFVIQGYHEHDNDIEFFFINNENRLVSSFRENNERLFLGSELEVDMNDYLGDEELDRVAQEVQDCMPNNFIYQETDGSLDNGFENITQPCTLDGHKALASEYKKAFETMINSGLRSHNTSTCGLHVHFNRSYFKDNEELYVTRLLLLVEKFWDNMVKFSRRNINNLNRWAKKYEMKAEEVAKINMENKYRLDRYHAINLTNSDTIEFRMFRGTLKVETYLATLEMVNNLVEFAKTKSVDEINVMKWEDLLTTDSLKLYWEVVKNRNIPTENQNNNNNDTNDTDEDILPF